MIKTYVGGCLGAWETDAFVGRGGGTTAHWAKLNKGGNVWYQGDSAWGEETIL